MINNWISKIQFSSFIIALLLLLGANTSKAQSWPGGVHDPSSIVKCDDTYYLFATGDGIYCMYSEDMITWKAGKSPFTKTVYPSWIKTYVPNFGGNFWAPDIIHMNDKYYLYYSCSEWGTMTSTIGCVTNKTLNPNSPDYAWEDVGYIGISSTGGYVNAIDPSVMRGADGKIWMVYGSFNRDGIMVTQIDSVSGKPIGSKTSIANSWTGPESWRYGEGEGGSMIYNDGYYYVFYNKGGCCAGIASTYYMVMGRSTSPTGPFYDKTGKAMRIVGAKSGGTVVMKHDDTRGTDDRYYGPGHFGKFTENGVDYVSFHYYDPTGFYPNEEANNQGGPTLGLAKLKWGEDGWPSITMDFVDEGVYTVKNAYSEKVIDALYSRVIDRNYLYQYDDDSTFNKKWVFTPLGTGEYNITNYTNPDIFVEAGSGITLSAQKKETVAQKFRTFMAPNGQTIIYPSIDNKFVQVSYNKEDDYQITLRASTNMMGQYWFMNKFEEAITVSEDVVIFDGKDSTNTQIVVESNGLWHIAGHEYDWLSIEPANGELTQNLSIHATQNPNQTTRSARVYVKSNGGEEFMIRIYQTGSTSTIHEKKLEALIYPNPATDQINVKVAEASVLEIYNSIGQRVKTENVNIGSTSIVTNDLQKGIYLFKLKSKTGSIENKIVIQ